MSHKRGTHLSRILTLILHIPRSSFPVGSPVPPPLALGLTPRSPSPTPTFTFARSLRQCHMHPRHRGLARCLTWTTQLLAASSAGHLPIDPAHKNLQPSKTGRVTFTRCGCHSLNLFNDYSASLCERVNI